MQLRLISVVSLLAGSAVLVAADSCSPSSSTADAGPDASSEASLQDVQSDVAPTDAASDVSNDADADAGCPSTTDYTSDSLNCATCAHSCFGGACITSTCQPLVIANASEHSPIQVVTDNTGAYWTNQGTNAANNTKDGTVRYWPNSSTTITSLATGKAAPRGIALTNTNFFFETLGDFSNTQQPLGNGQLLECPLVGCPSSPTVIVDASLSTTLEYSAPGIVQNSTKYFWAETDNTIYSAPLSGDAGGVAFVTTSPDWMVSDDSYLYWLVGKVIWKKSLGGGSPQQLYDGTVGGQLQSIAVDGTSLYALRAVSGGNELASCALPDCIGGLKSLSKESDGGAATTYGVALVADNNGVFWADNAYEGTATAAVLTCHTPGCTAVPIIQLSNVNCSHAAIGLSKEPDRNYRSRFPDRTA